MTVPPEDNQIVSSKRQCSVLCWGGGVKAAEASGLNKLLRKCQRCGRAATGQSEEVSGGEEDEGQDRSHHGLSLSYAHLCPLTEQQQERPQTHLRSLSVVFVGLNLQELHTPI